jgi:hypothetical protein
MLASRCLVTNIIWLTLQPLNCLTKDFLTALNDVCLTNEFQSLLE